MILLKPFWCKLTCTVVPCSALLTICNVWISPLIRHGARRTRSRHPWAFLTVMSRRTDAFYGIYESKEPKLWCNVSVMISINFSSVTIYRIYTYMEKLTIHCRNIRAHRDLRGYPFHSHRSNSHSHRQQGRVIRTDNRFLANIYHLKKINSKILLNKKTKYTQVRSLEWKGKSSFFAEFPFIPITCVVSIGTWTLRQGCCIVHGCWFRLPRASGTKPAWTTVVRRLCQSISWKLNESS